MQYFILKTTSDLSVAGAVPQLYDFAEERPYDRDYSRIYREFLSEELCMNQFKMQDEAIPTDFLSAAYLGLNGFFVAERLQRILADHDIPSSKWFPGTYFHKGDAHPLSFLQILELDDLDYGMSTYLIKGSKRDEFQAGSLEALRRKQSELNRAPRRPRLIPKKIKLKIHADLIKVPLSSDFLVSEALSERLVEENIIGYRLKKLREYEIA